MNNVERPDQREAQMMDVEVRQERARRIAETNRYFLSNLSAAADHWDEQNRLSIARGDGQLPF